MSGLDSSAILSFVKLKQLLQSHDIKLVFTDLSSTIHSQLQRGGCLQSDDPVCQVFSDLGSRLRLYGLSRGMGCRCGDNRLSAKSARRCMKTLL